MLVYICFMDKVIVANLFRILGNYCLDLYKIYFD